jgi:hypothetical protein
MNKFIFALAAVSILSLTAYGEDNAKVSFKVVARQKLESIDMHQGGFGPLNLKPTITATEGMHLELFRIQADAKWPGERTSTVYTDMELTYKGEKEELECAGCAYRNDLGFFEEDNAFQFLIRDPSRAGVTTASATRDFVFFIDDKAKDLTLRVTESNTEKEHVLDLPAAFTEKISVPEINVNVSVVSNKYVTSIATVDSVSYSPEVDQNINWTLTSGYFLIVDAKVNPDSSIAPETRTVTLEPKHFSLKLPDGSMIQAAGSITDYGDAKLHDSGYTHNFGRNEDGSWPDSDTTFVFIVGGKLKAFDLVFAPR